MAFFGRFDHSLDERGRVAVPARFREELRGGWVTGHPAGYLLMYPQAEWEAMTAELRYDPIAQAGYSGYLRRLYAASQEVTWDAQGRILLLPHLRQHANLTDNVVFVGVNNVIEVHSEQGFGLQAAPLDSAEWEAMRQTVVNQKAGSPQPLSGEVASS